PISRRAATRRVAASASAARKGNRPTQVDRAEARGRHRRSPRREEGIGWSWQHRRLPERAAGTEPRRWTRKVATARRQGLQVQGPARPRKLADRAGARAQLPRGAALADR